MPYGIETVGLNYTATATTGAQPYTAQVGQSLNVRALGAGSNATIEALWTHSSAAGQTRIRSPRLHDDVVGTGGFHYLNNASPILNEYYAQTVYSQDTLIAEDYWVVAPGAVAQQAAFNVYYDDLPGVSANIKSWAEVAPLIQSYFTVYVAPISAGAITSWGAGVAINSSQDVFKANSWYALIGYNTNVIFTAMSILGTDLGNLQYGGPGSVDPLITNRWFPFMENTSGKPSIPVINSQNKGATLVQVMDTTLTTTFYVGLIFAYLGPTG